MMRKITEIPATIFKQSKDINRKYRVAAYCRVSTDKEEQENSLENQITYYKNKVTNKRQNSAFCFRLFAHLIKMIYCR